MRITRNLTKGSCPHQLAALTFPLILGNILQQFYNTIDCYIAGRYISGNAFAAIGVAGSIMNLFIFVIYGCCNGISIVAAQLYGQRNWPELKKENFLSLIFGLGFTAVLSIAGICCLDMILKLTNTPAGIRGCVQDYLFIIILGLNVAFLYNWFSAILRAAGDSASALWILLISMFVNLLLDFVFIVKLHTGISGAAAATVISQAAASGACFAYMRKKYPELCFSKKDMYFDRDLLLKTSRLGFASALHQSSLYIGKLLVQSAVNSAGIAVITAYTAATRLEGFMNSFGDSGCAAISVFVGQNVGAENTARANQGFHTGVKMMALLSVVLSTISVLVTKPAAVLLLGRSDSDVIEQTFLYMVCISFFYIFCFIGNAFVGLYRGLGLVRVPVAGTVLHITVRVCLSYILISRMGLAAVALATGAGWICVVAFQYLYYKYKVWTKQAPQLPTQHEPYSHD